MLRILFISDFLPHLNADSAGVLDAAMLLNDLSKKSKVDLISNVSKSDLIELDKLKKTCNQVFYVRNRTFDNKLIYLIKTIFSFLSKLPAIMFMSYSLRFKILLKGILSRNEYDVIIIEFTQ